jgi:hypothetical protein
LIDFFNNVRRNTLIANDNYDNKRIRRHHQRIAEQYWKEKQISGDQSSIYFLDMLENIFIEVFFLL